MPAEHPLRVVIAGGGVAAVELTMALRDLAGDRVAVTLVAPERDFVVKALRTAEPFSRDHVRRYPLSGIAARFGAELRTCAVAGVDADRHVARLSDGAEVDYGALVLAVGARPRAAYDRVLTFGGDSRTEILNGLLTDVEAHCTRSVGFVVPPGVAWSLPLYELALMTAQHVRDMGITDSHLVLVTPEPAPLAIFGEDASLAVAALLDQAGIGFRGNAYAEDEGGRFEAERIVALPKLEGPRVCGVPHDEQGFIPIDEWGRVRGVIDVYAAGDGVGFPIKQGGLACQQADAIAAQLAAQSGAPVTPRPFRPMLRGELLTGRGRRYLRHSLAGGAGGGQASELALWFPATKVSGHYLSQWLAQLAGV